MEFMLLYKSITLTVQGTYTKYTRVYKTTICEKFKLITNHSFIFIVIQELYTYVIHFI